MATVGLALQMASYLVYYFLLTPFVSLILVVVSTVVSSVGASLFFSSNGKLVMQEIPPSKYGMASGTFRTMNNMGMICSFAVAIIVAASAVPKELAFEIFAGTSSLTEALMGPFVLSLRDAFIVSSAIMGLAVVLSWVRDTKKVETASLPPTNA
jgi:hypothetical protein